MTVFLNPGMTLTVSFEPEFSPAADSVGFMTAMPEIKRCWFPACIMDIQRPTEWQRQTPTFTIPDKSTGQYAGVLLRGLVSVEQCPALPERYRGLFSTGIAGKADARSECLQNRRVETAEGSDIILRVTV